ncbi:hypothetical protein GCM10009821_12560 [Aeromicrobium halocynthiae]|uniref:Mce-associated membrane protein n=1 Tax=Aeromicrobium halocynthiae TaxID=560557 RepID=A0ABP5HIL6_9ACTN
MSTEDKRPRRRIAGERPVADAAATPPRVVKRPVVRPPAVVPEETENQDRAVESPAVDGPGIEHAPVPDPAVEDSDAEDDSPPQDPPTDGPSRGTGTPRIVPAGRKQRTPSPAPVADAASPRQDAASEVSRSGTRRPLVAGVVLLAVLAVVLAGASIVWAAQQVAGADTESAQAEAADAAATAAETILGYRYDQLEQHLEESQALMTPEYGADFESLSPALNDLAPQRQIVVEAAAREVAPLPCGDDCSADRVEVLVFVDQARVVADDPEPTVFGNRISLTMVRDGDAWLVDDIEAY